MTGTDNVAAVVVTFNRLELLKSCIEALRNQSLQLFAIIIIDNSSTDGTGEWLKQQPDLLTTTQPNAGGAAGFFTGIKTAFEKGYEWIWCMDDDGFPQSNALENLLHYKNSRPCVINTLVCDKDNPQNLVFKTGAYTKLDEVEGDIIKDTANFFNGTLLHRAIIEKVGFPLKDLVIWGDESEYFNRIFYRYGYPLFTVKNSIHFHPAQSGVFYKKEWDVNKDWKPYFFIRNKIFVFLSKYKSRLRAYLAYAFFVLGFAVTILVYQKKNKLKKLNLLMFSATDGFKKSTSKTISDIKAYIASKEN